MKIASIELFFSEKVGAVSYGSTFKILHLCFEN